MKFSSKQMLSIKVYFYTAIVVSFIIMLGSCKAVYDNGYPKTYKSGKSKTNGVNSNKNTPLKKLHNHTNE